MQTSFLPASDKADVTQAFRVKPVWETAGSVAFPENATPKEAFAIANADFDVEEVDLQCAETGIMIPSHKQIKRSDDGTRLGIVGRDWVPVQNSQMIDLFNSLDGQISINNILVVGNGKKIFATAQVNEGREIADGHIVRRYLHVYNSHCSGSSYGVNFSDVNLVCANQLNFITGKHAANAIREGNGLRHAHTRGVTDFAANLSRLIDVQNQRFNRSVEELERMRDRTIDRDFTDAVLRHLYKKELAVPKRFKHPETGEKLELDRAMFEVKAIDRIRRHVRDGYGMESDGVQGTAYGLFQAITQTCTHDSFKDKTTEEQGMDTETARRRLESLWGGGENAKRINQARQLILSAI